jgi:hypothetical protein
MSKPTKALEQLTRVTNELLDKLPTAAKQLVGDQLDGGSDTKDTTHKLIQSDRETLIGYINEVLLSLNSDTLLGVSRNSKTNEFLGIVAVRTDRFIQRRPTNSKPS